MCEESAHNCWLLYETAVNAFYLERYRLAIQAFSHLRHVSAGHHNRSGVLESAGDRHGDQPWRYIGSVVRDEALGRYALTQRVHTEVGLVGSWGRETY
jgi:hypothetical protein